LAHSLYSTSTGTQKKEKLIVSFFKLALTQILDSNAGILSFSNVPVINSIAMYGTVPFLSAKGHP
jgi:hypothetical protein